MIDLFPEVQVEMKLDTSLPCLQVEEKCMERMEPFSSLHQIPRRQHLNCSCCCRETAGFCVTLTSTGLKLSKDKQWPGQPLAQKAAYWEVPFCGSPLVALPSKGHREGD